MFELYTPPSFDYFFNITEGNEAGRFRIDDSTGEIFLNQALDARAQDFYNLMVVAHLRSTDCRRGRVYIEVYVVAANENPPVFQATIPVDVIETVVVSTPVVQVTASDADFGMNSEVRYSITGGNTGDAFTINPTTGEISIAAALNHTIQSFYDLMLTATDQAASNPMSATITQRVNVLDVNQRPFFRTSCAVGGTCSFSFAEDTATNTILETITAGDPDTSTNAQLDFTFNPSTTLFAISSNGQISLQNSVDRETVSQYMFNLTVSDRGSPSLGISTAVTFVVTDVNDNAPDLTLPSQVSISENAFVGDGVLQASATDVDIGSNARISYTLITGSPLFTIDVSTGAVTLAQTLDYETDTQHFVVVSAFNPDGLSSPLHTATVLVINENDNAPVFTLSTYTASVAEGSSTGTPVVTVLANDQDSGVLGDVTYSITGGNSNNNFAINSTSGMITVSGDIDREVVGEYRLTVRAQDGGNPARSDTSTVTITVLDVNDNSPVFQRSSYSISVREDANFPLELQTLLAIDADEANTQNSAITYAIESGNVGDVFNLSRTTGMLTLVGQLDFEAMQSYSLTVIATDGGSLTGRATVTVTVIDLNDEAPQISGSQSVSLNETTSVGFVVAEFRSTSEEGEVLTFTIIPDNCFDIDSMTGVVTLAASLDYETQQTFTAQVSVTDGLFFTSATLTVNVVDENDNAPQITSTGPFTIEEEMSVGTLVGTILAFDLDTVGDPLSFSFVGTEILSYFTLNSSSGEIRTADILDRELLESVFPPSGSSQTYAVRASDGVFSSSAGVTITLLDINDNTPMFNDLLTEYDVLENSAMGVEVFVATATDDDLGSNAIVSYSISTSPFAIDTSTGSVTVAGILDYEMATEHSVTITASDGTLSSSQNVTIRVVDVNDNAPVFSQDTYTAMIVEHSSDNTTVTSVVATDDDSGANGRVSYSLANTNTFFSINPSSGEIVVIGDIDRETVTQFTFTVVATDGGNPAQRDTASVIVSVTDINDNAPTFQQSSYTVRVREDAATSSEILTVLATDDDETGNPNSQIDYSFQPDNAVFSISGSGVISLQATLDFENASSYSLVAVATDRGDPMMNGTTNVNIIVINVNDQPPEFSGDQNIELSELTPVPSQIARFTATSDNGEMITYSLSGVQNGEFAINATNGIVTLMTPLDYETTQFYSLTITASDSLFSTPSTLNITVLDENDNTPQFEPVNTLQIDEEQPAGTPVGQVTANDADSGANADLRYSFVQSSTRNYFTIDTSSGEITTVSTLDRELLVQENLFLPPASQITFQVQATDGGSPPLFSQIDVTVQLNDINDNPPQFINPPASY
ncbi:protocadherin Fat 4-like [Dysidea avara]|uniref:protocadherin Fat 4-like n=1 Tax=Dysidea avara TaxID=196820 RepID=UPI00332A0286